jgi:hypothetical protein|tara:strand:+ start:512 stop:1243 length:732 start_codon:yes stop_codon:yes gene_type:complete
MDIRQIVMVSSLRDPIVSDLSQLFGLEVAFNDPGVGHFGLENAVMPLGTDFLEVVSPIEENTTAGRYLQKRGGDGGYMVIIQVDDFDKTKSLVHDNEIEIVWDTDLPEAKAIHLHPKQMGGAIVSLDWMNPKESWKWAGPEWNKYITDDIKGIDGVEIQANNPEEMFNRWKDILDASNINESEKKIYLDNTWISFTDEDDRGSGISAFSLITDNKELLISKAKEFGFLQEDNIVIGGVKFYLN